MNKAYKLILSILIISCSVLCMPFSYIKAESQSLAPPFLGVNLNVINVDNNSRWRMVGTPSIESDGRMDWYCKAWVSSGCDLWSNVYPNGSNATHTYDIYFNGSTLQEQVLSTKYLVELEFIFDNVYVGQFQVQYDNATTGLIDQIVYVNGSSVKINVYDLDLSSSISVYGVNLQNNVSHSWNYPIESFNFIQYFWSNNRTLNGFHRNDTYIFPIFDLKPGDSIYRITCNPGIVHKCVAYFFGINPGSTSQVRNMFSNTNLVIQNFKSIQPLNISSNNSLNGRCIYFEITNNTDSTIIEEFTYTYNRNIKIIPIFMSQFTDYISTDFALNFGLTNPVLDNLDLIANGNNSSSSSVSSAQQSNQQAQSTFQQEEQIISDHEDTMQDNLDNLDIANKNNNLFGNSKFIASAQWVKTQFDWFTNNNAFGYLITFSLVIGIALVIVGKLRG